MARGRRKTRKMLLKKEDQFITTTRRALEFLSAYRGRFLSLLVAILVLGGAYGAYTLYSNRQERQAALALYQDRALFTPLLTRAKLDPQEARKAVDKLAALVHEYPHTSSAVHAAYYLGHLQYRLGDYKQAVTSFRRVADGAPSAILRELGFLNLGSAQEAAGDCRSAIASYEKVVADEQSLFRDRALESVGRCYEILGDHTKAVEIYTQFLDQYPNSPWADEAKEGLARLQSAG